MRIEIGGFSQLKTEVVQHNAGVSLENVRGILNCS